MSFAAPTAFWLAACAIPIMLFYILKVRLRRQPVSTNLFWKQIYDEKPPRSIRHRFRHLLSLLVQLLLLALLVGAAADPILPGQLQHARRIVAVVDRSASMQATDVAPTRFHAAIDAALSLADGLRFRDEMAIVTTGSQPTVVLGLSGHLPALRRALRGITVSDEPASLEPAITLAKQILGDHLRGQVIVFSDGCVEGGAGEKAISFDDPSKPDSRVPGDVELRTFAGVRPSNVGITQFQARRSLVDPLGYDVLVTVENRSDQEVQCRLEIERNGLPVDVLPLRLAPDETWRRTLQKTSVSGGTLTARLRQIEGTDGDNNDAGESLNRLHVDDVATTNVPARERQRVLLITDENVFLEKVFQANPLVTCDVLRELPDTIPEEAIVVFHRHVRSQLPPVDILVVDPIDTTVEWEVGDFIENPIVTYQRSDSPLMTHVHLDNFLMHRARRISFRSPPVVLASTISGDVVYAELQRDQGKGLLLSVDLDESDLAFRTAFPIMVTNALRWFRDDRNELDEGPTPSQVIAAKRESDLRPNEEWLRQSSADVINASVFSRPLWFYLVVFATGLVVAEWCLYQRRVIQ